MGLLLSSKLPKAKVNEYEQFADIICISKQVSVD
jgi:hypothetical protein